MTMVKPDLRAEAVAEARRLARARALTGEREEEALGVLEGDRPWAVSARGWRTRMALSSRVALIYRIAFEDGSGATAEARLIAIAIDITRARRRPTYRTIEALVRQIEPRIQSEIAVATADWRRSVEQSVRSFASARLARRRAIAAVAVHLHRREYQPGLFDRRADRARDQASEDSAGTDTFAASQLAATSLSDAITQRPPQLLLVLTP